MSLSFQFSREQKYVGKRHDQWMLQIKQWAERQRWNWSFALSAPPPQSPTPPHAQLSQSYQWITSTPLDTPFHPQNNDWAHSKKRQDEISGPSSFLKCSHLRVWVFILHKSPYSGNWPGIKKARCCGTSISMLNKNTILQKNWWLSGAQSNKKIVKKWADLKSLERIWTHSKRDASWRLMSLGNIFRWSPWMPNWKDRLFQCKMQKQEKLFSSWFDVGNIFFYHY